MCDLDSCNAAAKKEDADQWIVMGVLIGGEPIPAMLYFCGLAHAGAWAIENSLDEIPRP